MQFNKYPRLLRYMHMDYLSTKVLIPSKAVRQIIFEVVSKIYKIYLFISITRQELLSLLYENT